MRMGMGKGLGLGLGVGMEIALEVWVESWEACAHVAATWQTWHVNESPWIL